MRIICFLALLTLAGCTAQRYYGAKWEKLMGPDGGTRYAITGGEIADGYRAAAKLCSGRTYVILDQRAGSPDLSLHAARKPGYFLLVACR